MTASADALPAGWHEAALDPPRSQGAPAARGAIKTAPADFVVEEQLGFAPDGGSAHVLLSVQKTDANTLDVAQSLARHAGVRVPDVGFAGLKDRQAVATQWFSVPASKHAVEWHGLRGHGFEVLQAGLEKQLGIGRAA